MEKERGERPPVLYRDEALVIPVAPGEAPYIVGQQCRSCQAVWLFSRESCPACLAADLRRLPLSRRGKVYSYTVVHVGYSGFTTPYVLAYVDLPEGIRLTGQIDAEGDAIQLEMDVEVAVGRIREVEGAPLYGWVFRPVVHQ